MSAAAADVSPLALAHPMPPFDGHIRFDEGPHRYYVTRADGEGGEDEYASTTSVLDRVMPHFDAALTIRRMMASPRWPASPYFGQTAEAIAAGWARAGADASALGTAMHSVIEQAMDGRLADWDVAALAADGTRPELVQFLAFWDTWLRPRGLVPWRMELRTFSRRHRVAGSIDGLFLNPATRRLVMIDWKRVADLDESNRYGSRALPPVAHLAGTKFVKYELQQNAYRYYLENAADTPPDDAGEPLARPYRVEAMYLACFHPKRTTFHVAALADRQGEIADILNAFSIAAASLSPPGNLKQDEKNEPATDGSGAKRLRPTPSGDAEKV